MQEVKANRIKWFRPGIFAVLFSAFFVLSVSASAVESNISDKARAALNTPVTYSCVDRPIDEVLVQLAELAGIDIIKSPQVSGNVTVKLTDVPLEEALSNILSAHSYTYIATENMIRVIPLPQTAVFEKELVTRVYHIIYADANEVAAALLNFVSENGKVALNRGTSHIMVTDTQDKVRGIDQFISQIDQKTPQVIVEVRIYDVKSQEGFELSPDWYVGRNTPLKTIVNKETVTRTGIDSDAPSSLTRTTVTDVVGEGEMPFSGQDAIVGLDPGETAAYLPNEYRSYSIEDHTEEVRTQEILDPYGYSNIEDVDKQTTYYTEQRRKPFVAGSFDREIGGTINFSLLNDVIDLEFALSVLHTQVEAKLLANPRVLVLDNQTANFEIIREIPYREMRQVAREDPITYTEFKDVGVSLRVTPHVARDGMIRLRIQPELGDVVSFNLEGIPTVDTRRADTVALIRDGQTIVLGGLRKKETTKDIRKVPVFGDMPLVGGLFKAQTESVVTSELIIFITIRIVDEYELSGQESGTLEESRRMIPEFNEIQPEQERERIIQSDEEIKSISDILEQLLQQEQK